MMVDKTKLLENPIIGLTDEEFAQINFIFNRSQVEWYDSNFRLHNLKNRRSKRQMSFYPEAYLPSRHF